MAHRRTRVGVARAAESRTEIDVNAIVSFNVRFIRQLRGLTQDQVARKLGALTGHQLPQASISAMERGFDGQRRRRFDAHELYLLALVFEVPILYLFIPPPGSDRSELADSRKPTSTLIDTLIGAGEGLERVDERLAGLAIGLAPDLSPTSDGWMDAYREWRQERLRHIEEQHADELDQVADLLVQIGTQIQQCGPSGFLESFSGDTHG